MQRYKVKTHKWIEGLLETEEFLFETAREAMDFAYFIVADTIRIFEDEILVHVISNKNENEFYA